MLIKILYFIKVLLSLITTVIVLSVFTLFYKYSSVHITNQEQYTDYKWEPGMFYSNMNEGFTWAFLDENGFNNKYVYPGNKPLDQRSVDILLMGSSHMAANNVMPDECTGYLLNLLLPNNYTYNIGTAGHTIYHNFKNIGFACAKFKPKKYVVVETNLVELDPKQMEKVNNGTYPAIKSYDKGIVFFLQKKVPCFKLLYNKLEEWHKLDTKKALTEQKIVHDATYMETVNCFIKRAATIVQNSDAKLIIVYHNGAIINKDGCVVPTTNADALTVFAGSCRKNGVIFINCDGAANRLYTQEKVMLHGFSNSAVGRGHLNKYGHKLLATEIAKVIKNL